MQKVGRRGGGRAMSNLTKVLSRSRSFSVLSELWRILLVEHNLEQVYKYGGGPTTMRKKCASCTYHLGPCEKLPQLHISLAL